MGEDGSGLFWGSVLSVVSIDYILILRKAAKVIRITCPFCVVLIIMVLVKKQH
jgi:choline-glycine betaine transporter